jgi:hypothetical protein
VCLPLLLLAEDKRRYKGHQELSSRGSIDNSLLLECLACSSGVYAQSNSINKSSIDAFICIRT